jgi:hypothetical protein
MISSTSSSRFQVFGKGLLVHSTVGDLGDVESPAGRVQYVVALAGYLTNPDADGRFEFAQGSPLERLEKAGGEGFNRMTFQTVRQFRLVTATPSNS